MFNTKVVFRVAVSQIQPNVGTPIPIPPQGLVLVVGANNVGKSQLLIDIANCLTDRRQFDLRVLNDIVVDKEGTVEDLETWLLEHSHVRHEGNTTTYSRVGREIDRSSATSRWSNGYPFGHLAPMFHSVYRAGDRLNLVAANIAFNVFGDRPTTALQTLYVRPDLEARLSGLTKEAFGFGVTLHRHSGSMIHLLVGEVQHETQPTREYLEALNALPSVEAQGDGVRSYVGLLLSTLAADFPIVLVDEPEAFLHPPQARKLGLRLAEIATAAGGQVFAATHSLDVVLGALSSGVPVTIVRVTRSGSTNPCFALDSERVNQTWSDPLLRYSRILDSLFFSGVVLCESDSDCRFYDAVLDSLQPSIEAQSDDILFTHCGGKQRLASVVNSLKALDTKTAVIADLDILNDRVIFRRLVESLDGEWNTFETDYSAIVGFVTSIGYRPRVSPAREQINDLLNQDEEGGRVSRDTADRITDIVRHESGWRSLKRSGLAALSNGDVVEAAQRLIRRCAELGLFVVTVGELERWIPSIGGHGPQWVASVLADNAHKDTRAGPAQQFVAGICRFLRD